MVRARTDTALERRSESVETVADAYLALLAARGIDYIFGNGGTDFAPIVPKVIICATLSRPYLRVT